MRGRYLANVEEQYLCFLLPILSLGLNTDFFCYLYQQACGPRVERRVPTEVYPGPQAPHVQESAVLQDGPLALCRLHTG